MARPDEALDTQMLEVLAPNPTRLCLKSNDEYGPLPLPVKVCVPPQVCHAWPIGYGN